MPIEVADGSSPLFRQFRHAMHKMHGDDDKRIQAAMAAAHQVVQFIDRTCTADNFTPPKLIIPGTEWPVPISTQRPNSCFAAADDCCALSVIFSNAAFAACYLPAEVLVEGIVPILDESKYLWGTGNPLRPRNPISRLLSGEWKANLARWADNLSFALAAGWLANHMGAALYRAQGEGIELFNSLTPKPISRGAIHKIGNVARSTATETVLLATKAACNAMRDAGIDNGEMVFAKDLATTWRWLVEHGIGAMLPSGEGAATLQTWKVLIEQEKADWEQAALKAEQRAGASVLESRHPERDAEVIRLKNEKPGRQASQIAALIRTNPDWANMENGRPFGAAAVRAILSRAKKNRDKNKNP